MTTDIYTIQTQFQDGASAGLGTLKRNVKDTDSQVASLTALLGKTSVELGKNADGAKRYSEQVEGLSARLKVSKESLDRLLVANRDTNETYDEAGQKLLDVRKRLDEYGASAELQEEAVLRLLTGVDKSNLPLARQALVLEELAIEFQDGRKALDFYEEGLALVEKRGGRVEDAIAKLTQAAKGDTAALSGLGPVAEAAASKIGQIRDRSLRSAETLRVFRREVDRVPDGLDKVNDRLTLAQSRFDGFIARLGPAGVLAGVAGVALAGLAIGGVKVAGDAVEAYTKQNKEAAQVQEAVALTADAAEVKFGELIFKVLDLDEVNQGLISTNVRVEEGLALIVARVDDLARATPGAEEAVERLAVPILKLVPGLGTFTGGLLDISNGLQDTSALSNTTISDLERLEKQLSDTADEAIRLARELPGDNRARRNAARLLSTDKSLRGAADSEIGEDEVLQGPLLPGSRFFEQQDREFLEAERRAELASQQRSGGGRRKRADVVNLIEQAQEDYLREQDRVARLLDVLLSVGPPGEGDGFASDGFTITAADERNAEAQRLSDQAKLIRDQRQRRLDELRVRAGLEDDDDFASAAPLEEFDLTSQQGLDAFEAMIDRSERLNQSLNNLATQGVGSLVAGLTDLVGGLATGEIAAKDFGGAFLNTFGSVLERAGQGMVLLGLGTLNIAQGLTNPAALIAVGAGAVIAGKALQGASSSFGGGAPAAASASSGSSATQEAFRTATDRILDRRDQERQAQNFIFNLDGDVIRGVVERQTAALAQQGIFAPAGGI